MTTRANAQLADCTCKRPAGEPHHSRCPVYRREQAERLRKATLTPIAAAIAADLRRGWIYIANGGKPDD